MDNKYCTTSGKRMYPEKEEALKAASAGDVPLRVYFCMYCHTYHLTSKRT